MGQEWPSFKTRCFILHHPICSRVLYDGWCTTSIWADISISQYQIWWIFRFLYSIMISVISTSHFGKMDLVLIYMITISKINKNSLNWSAKIGHLKCKNNYYAFSPVANMTMVVYTSTCRNIIGSDKFCHKIIHAMLYHLPSFSIEQNPQVQ